MTCCTISAVTYTNPLHTQIAYVMTSFLLGKFCESHRGFPACSQLLILLQRHTYLLLIDFRSPPFHLEVILKARERSHCLCQDAMAGEGEPSQQGKPNLENGAKPVVPDKLQPAPNGRSADVTSQSFDSPCYLCLVAIRSSWQRLNADSCCRN